MKRKRDGSAEQDTKGDAQQQQQPSALKKQRTDGDSKQDGEERTEWVFYSRSADPDLAYLSNFTPVPNPQKHPIVLDGHGYATIEHGYQAAKFKCLDNKAKWHPGQTSNPAQMKRFTVAGELGQQPANVAKSAGGKGGMRAAKCALDSPVWGKQQDEVMRGLVYARAAVDSRYASLLKKAAARGITLLHFESGAPRSWGKTQTVSHWGGYRVKATGEWRGNNALGKILGQVGAALLQTEREQFQQQQQLDKRTSSPASAECVV